ncbi:hypothetical protein PROFUN_07522 [Planoprotostelium fungivorum]|uniref:Nitrogen permease regulator 2 n=1 Tax=Planoprotostelium fungivorum TaxID=1890364 RepID=A0A2P6NLU6_9EUKA|nr:hypothetical protein PROFUN_07522 [Planoprotostelium fungivorum]
MSALKGILFSEFDHIVGPKISFQLPQGCISVETFEVSHEYIITKPNLAGRLITFSVSNLLIMGHPILLEDSKYPRNYYLFNLCFILDRHVTQYEQVNPPSPLKTEFEQVLRKLANQLRTIERESEFVSSQDTRQTFQKIVTQVFHSLCDSGQCAIPVDEANIINLRLFPKLKNPPGVVMEHQVPIITQDIDLLSSRQWDLAVQQVLPHIDGINHIKKISTLSKVSLDTVQKCIQQLMYLKYVSLVDIFQYSNIYTCTPSIYDIANDPAAQDECVRYVCRSDSAPPPPSFDKIFSLYASLKPSLCLRDFCQEHDTAFQRIDVRRFILFGVLNGFIRRVHRYPLMKRSQRPQQTMIKGNSATLRSGDLDGKKSCDQLCSSLSIPFDKLDQSLKSDKEIVLLCK